MHKLFNGDSTRHSSHFKLKWFLRGVVFAILFVALFSLILMLLWNSLMPGIFGITGITYLQAAGLLILSKILFSGFGKKGEHSFHNKKEFLRQKFAEKCGKESGGEGSNMVGNG